MGLGFRVSRGLIMEIQDLNNKWLLLEGEITGNFKSLRLDSKSIPDLFIGRSVEGNRCLILKLPQGYKADFQSSIRQNLSLELFEKSRWIVLSLLEEQYYDLFNDLILSIYNKVVHIDKASIYVSELLKTYYKWSEFFLDSSSYRLSDEEIKGLFGELTILHELLLPSNSSNLNDVLNSWKGPYDTGHDFILEEYNIEVKTKNSGAANIKISSEYQLQSDPGKGLELAIVTVLSDSLEGDSMKDQVLKVRDYVMERLGDYSIVLKTLSQKGLNLKNLDSYEHLRFKIQSIITYDCNDQDFPKITRASLVDSINSVSYNLNINQIHTFIKTQLSPSNGDSRIS